MKITLRKATAEDEEFVLTTHHLAYRDVVVAQFGEWDEQRQDNYFYQKWFPEKIDLIEFEGSLAGYLIVETLPNHIFLSEIVILPNFQNKGIGRKLIEDQCAKAIAAALPLRLRVLKANRAIDLYTRLGFQRYGETETHVQMEAQR